MTQRGPWSVKGIDSRAREVAREAAREEGMTLGAYLNKLILEEGQPPHAQQPNESQTSNRAPRRERVRSAEEQTTRSAAPTNSALDRLMRRIESAEARSTLAITGIDQSVVGLLSRLENAEHNQQAMGGHFEGLMDDIQKTYEALNLKIQRIEEDESSASNLRALKALEDALGKLASHVYQENELVGEETGAIKARLESGFAELGGRMDNIDTQIEDKLNDATADFQQAIQEAELRTEGTSRHLAERFSAIELDVADKLSHVSGMSNTMNDVHEDVTASLSGMNTMLAQIQERLSRAETLTDKAMHGLESRFEALDTRLADVQAYANEDVDQSMRRQFEDRFESLSEDLRQLVAATRVELAEEIEAATNSVDSNMLDKLSNAIGTINSRLEANDDMHAQTMEMVSDTVSRITESVEQRLSANQDQQARAMDQVTEQVTRISDSLETRLGQIELSSGKVETDALREEMIRFTNTLDERLEFLESREEATFDKVSAEVEKLADQLEQRVTQSEQRSAKAIEQVGEQVSSVAGRIEQRQREALTAFTEKLNGTQKRQDARLNGALSNVSDRLERMQEQSLLSISPVQKAITALAQRIEAIEDFSAPPYAERGETPSIPDMVEPSKIDTSVAPAMTAETSPPAQDDMSELEGFLSPVFSSDPDEMSVKKEIDNIDIIASDLDVGVQADKPSEDFEPGYQSWAEDANAILDDTLGGGTELTPENTKSAASDLAPPPMLDAEPGWHDDPLQTQDSDIFDTPFDQAPSAPDAFEPTAQQAETAYQEDYIMQARRAARDAATTDSKYGIKKPVKSNTSDGIAPKRAGLAALAAVAVVGTAGVLYMRSQSSTPAVNFDQENETASTLTALNAPNELVNSESDGTLADETPETAALAENTPPTDGVTASVAAALPVEADEENVPEVDVFEDAAPPPTLIPDPKPVSASTTPPRTAPTVFNAPRIPTRPSLGQAAQDGNRIAQFQAGMADLRSGRFTSGANWLRKAAEQGSATAQHELAILHENGTGTARDFAEARRWHGVAARSGHVEAMYDFATYNINGEGGAANASVAAEWFRKAAEYGHTDSQYNLAQLYTQGSGVTPSQIDALFWFELAARTGDVDARQSADELISSGSVSQEAAAQVRQRVANWRPSAKNPVANGQFGAQPWENNTGGSQTLAVQQVLSALGYNVGTPDGVMGQQTRIALRAFEQSQGLPVTGSINPQVVDALNAAADAERRRT